MCDVMLTLTIIDVMEIGGREFILTRGCLYSSGYLPI